MAGLLSLMLGLQRSRDHPYYISLDDMHIRINPLTLHLRMRATGCLFRCFCMQMGACFGVSVCKFWVMLGEILTKFS